MNYEDINIVVLCNFLQGMHALAFCCTWQNPAARKNFPKKLGEIGFFTPWDHLEGPFNVTIGCESKNTLFRNKEMLKKMLDWKSCIDTSMIVVYQIFFGDKKRKYFEKITTGDIIKIILSYLTIYKRVYDVDGKQIQLASTHGKRQNYGVCFEYTPQHAINTEKKGPLDISSRDQLNMTKQETENVKQRTIVYLARRPLSCRFYRYEHIKGIMQKVWSIPETGHIFGVSEFESKKTNTKENKLTLTQMPKDDLLNLFQFWK
tara:strand:- start:1658 stop:2440 length:783 start_codon:yes stop_codon:yes gene_type:complete